MARVVVSGQFSLTRLSLCLGLAFGGGVAWAQNAPVQPVASLKEVVISGSRIEQDIDEVPATITTISAEKMARENPSDLEDLLKDEVGVSVKASPYRPSMGGNVGRGGNEGVNIRGLEGDQVRIQVDGVSLPSTYNSGPFFASRGDYLDPEGSKRVEILRGASGTMYGSDGLAGMVSFVTKDPEDLLTLGKNTQFNLKSGYSSADNSWQLAPSFAFKGDSVQGMVLVSSRSAHATINMGTNESLNTTRTAANPMDIRSDYLLAKLILAPSATHQVKLTAEALDRKTTADVFSARAVSPTATSAADFDTQDAVTRNLLKMDYRFVPNKLWFDVLTTSVYLQRSVTQQDQVETRGGAGNRRLRDTRYAEDAAGVSLQMETNVGSDVTQRIVYGAELGKRDITSFKGGSNGTEAAFTPNKSFPDTDYLTLGAFVQDEIGIGKVSITPGVRFESYRLSPRNDTLYAASGAPTSPVELSDSAVSPRLGLVWNLDKMLAPFVQYAHGFRAPRPTDVNGAFSNLASGYTSVTNPNLKAETSNSIELGLRGRDSNTRYSVSAFHAQYKDFMSQEIVSGAGTPGDPSVYKTINLPSATISGLEARGEWTLSPGWTFSAAYAYAEGVAEDQKGTKGPLATIDPEKIILGMDYARDARWGVGSRVTMVERKDQVPANRLYTPEGYTVVDLSGWYKFSKATVLQYGVRNLFDKKYVQWADVNVLPVSTTAATNAATLSAIDTYTQPGRNFTVSVTHSF